VSRRPTYALHEERDLYQIHFYIIVDFLIHTLRGERDEVSAKQCCRQYISTHTLRGERDAILTIVLPEDENFNSHAPWGA